MRRGAPSALAIPGLLALGIGAAGAQESTLLACDSLVALRLVTARPPGERPTESAGCARIARERLGAVERRAMLGGAPYECLALKDAGRCAWIAP